MVATEQPRSNREISTYFPLHPEKYTLFCCDGLFHKESQDLTSHKLSGWK